MFTNTTVILGAIYSASHDQNPQAPAWRGDFHVEGEHGRFSCACWVKTASGGNRAGANYLSLVFEPLGADGKPFKVFGTLYKSTAKRSAKDADHFGRLNLTGDRDGPTLRISGWDREFEGGRLISIRIDGQRPDTQLARSDAAAHYDAPNPWDQKPEAVGQN